jgi:hypothetical protein
MTNVTDMQTTETCPLGHQVVVGSAYCSECGRRLREPSMARVLLLLILPPFVACLGVLAGAGRATRVEQISTAPPPTARTPSLAQPAHYTIYGNFALIDYKSAAAGCQGQGGFGDVTPGTQVTATDAAGRVIGVAVLGIGRRADSIVCYFRFRILAVPKATFYSLHVGSRRGFSTKSFVEMQRAKWAVDISLGTVGG